MFNELFNQDNFNGKPLWAAFQHFQPSYGNQGLALNIHTNIQFFLRRVPVQNVTIYIKVKYQKNAFACNFVWTKISLLAIINKYNF